jgi:sugar phosphate isomerase/epimerase
MNLERRTDGPHLGLNMHPRWVGDGPAEAFLFPLRELGLEVLEFTLNLSWPDWPEMSSLIEECRQLGFRLSFHAPFKGPYNPAGFSGTKRAELQALYAPAIHYAARVAEEMGPVTLVVHGAKGNQPPDAFCPPDAFYPRETLKRDTEAFLTWILGESPVLHISLELLSRDRGVTKIGDSKAELLDIVSGLASARVGICWDLGHDARNGSVPASWDFALWVNHVHAHDISPVGADGRSEDHCPLVFGNVPYGDHLHLLGQAGYDGAIILEVNGYYVCDLAAARGIPPIQLLQDSFMELARLTSNWRAVR